jgi:phosphatidylserine/phosphatidylglycerophosphate/cardiolipin synthase-like enzyme
MSSTSISHIASWGYHSSILTNSSIEQPAPVDSAVTFAANVAHKVSVLMTTIGAFLISFPGAMVVLLGITALYYGAHLYSQQRVCETAGLIVQKPEDFETLKLIPETGDCEALPTDHSAETEQWRKKLLEAAEENIIISGNYCGGNSFLELLIDLEEQMQKKAKLKVIVISSPMFLTQSCIEKMKELRKKYPERFSAIESGDILHVSPGVKKATNHTKCMVIDYGKYFILGGSGIKEQFTGTGMIDQSKEQYLQENNHPALKLKPDTSGGQGVIAQIMKGDLRDMDFVFHSKYGNNSVGRQVYRQMLLLSHRWEQYNKMVKGEKVTPRSAQLGAFDGQPSEISPEDSVALQLMKTPCPHWAFVRSTVPSFDQSPKKAKDVAFKVLASGPEHKKSHYAEEVLHHIKNAKESIALNHMYFHPTDEIMNALIAAGNRGVKITIITCGVHEGGPTSHHIFGPRNKANCAHLYNAVNEEHRKNIEVYEYNQGNNGLHKKAIIIDDTVIAGSSNLGYKSLVTTNDHELNFFASSRAFAEATRKVFQTDIKRSYRRLDFSLKTKEHFMNHAHRNLAFLIG